MRLLILAAFGAVIFATAAASQPHQRSPLAGRWVGTGTLFDHRWDGRVGALACSLALAYDGSGGGRIGAAQFDLLRSGDREIVGRLNAPVAPLLATKEYVVLVITSVTDSTLEGEFHLKSNRYFDLRMREGRLSMRRIRE